MACPHECFRFGFCSSHQAKRVIVVLRAQNSLMINFDIDLHSLLWLSTRACFFFLNWRQLLQLFIAIRSGLFLSVVVFFWPIIGAMGSWSRTLQIILATQGAKYLEYLLRARDSFIFSSPLLLPLLTPLPIHPVLTSYGISLYDQMCRTRLSPGISHRVVTSVLGSTVAWLHLA